MSQGMEPQRLRELDSLFQQAVEQAHAHVPSSAAVDAIVQAVQASSSGGASAVGALDATLAVLKSTAFKLVAVATVSSGLCWAVQERLAVPRFPSGLDEVAPSVEVAAAPVRNTNAPAPGPSLLPIPSQSAPLVAPPRQPDASPQHPSPTSITSATDLATDVPRRVARGERTTVDRDATVDIQPRTPRYERRRMSAHEPAHPHASSHGGTRRARPPASRPLRRVEPILSRADDSPSAPAELELLEAAQQALQTSPEQALVLTDRHRREHPSGAFSQEREQIAIEALYAEGNLPAMRARAHRFREAFPRSAYSGRIRELLQAAR